MGDIVEDVRHVAEMGHGEDRVQKLALPPVLRADGGQHARAEKQLHVAVINTTVRYRGMVMVVEEMGGTRRVLTWKG